MLAKAYCIIVNCTTRSVRYTSSNMYLYFGKRLGCMFNMVRGNEFISSDGMR